MSEMWYATHQREAAERAAALVALPVPETDFDIGVEGFFDPWSLFPLYGTYSSEFDECALDVLRGLRWGEGVRRNDLASDFFREMLCNLHLCEYGTSPRACFPTPGFALHLPALIEKWEAYTKVVWFAALSEERGDDIAAA